MKKAASTKQLINLNQIGPSLDLVGCWHFEEDVELWSRNPAHVLSVIEHGGIETRVPQGLLCGKARDLIYFPPATQIRYRVRAPTIIYQAAFHFAPPPLHLHTPYFPGKGPLPFHLPLGTLFEEMRALFETLCIEQPRLGAEPRLRVQATIYHILAVIARAMDAEPSMEMKVDDWERTRIRLDSTAGHKFQISDLAREMNVSVQYFQRGFRRRFHSSPKAYQLHSRIGEAVRRLREGDVSFKTIAYEMGFRDPKTLASAIRRHLGVGPAQLRLMPLAKLGDKMPKSGKLFPLNRHFVPPGTPANWIKKYDVGKRSVPKDSS